MDVVVNMFLQLPRYQANISELPEHYHINISLALGQLRRCHSTSCMQKMSFSYPGLQTLLSDYLCGRFQHTLKIIMHFVANMFLQLPRYQANISELPEHYHINISFALDQHRRCHTTSCMQKMSFSYPGLQTWVITIV